MEGIVLTDEDLNTLEKRLGPDLRKMGPWITDGIFGYCWVSLAVLEEAAESVEDPNLMMAVLKLRDASERIGPFIGLLESSGHSLIERIVAAYGQGSFGLAPGTSAARKPAERQGIKAMAAVG